MKLPFDKKDVVLFGILALAYFALRLPWLFSVPLMEAPDEANHLWVAHFFAQHSRAPSAAEISQAGSIAVYGPLSPYGYLPNALFGSLSLDSDFFRLLSRLGTLLAGLPTIFLAILLGRRIFQTKPLLSLMLPLLVIAHPQLIFTQSYTNTDALVTTLSSLAVYLCVVFIQGKTSILRASMIGVVLGLAALTKTNSICLVPAVAWGIWVACRQHKLSLSQTLARLGALTAAFGLTTVWQFVRNYFEFEHDVFGSKTMYKIWEKSLEHEDGVPVLPWPHVTKLAWWRFVFFDYWGLFGFMNHYLWRPLYFAYLGLSTTALAGYCLKSTAQEDSTEHSQKNIVWKFFAVSTALNMLAVFYVTASGLSGPHGRYLFPNELPILALILGGFERFNDKTQKALALSLLFISLASTISGFLTYYIGHSWIE